MFHHILITSFNANSPPRNSYTSARRPNLLSIKYPNRKRREENGKQGMLPTNRTVILTTT